MAIETTLILVKPDGVSRNLIGEIAARIERKGYVITAMKLMQLSGDKAREHYGEHKDKPFFGELVTFITSGPLVALAVEGEGAVEGLRQIIGATDPLKAAPGSIRADLARSIGSNLVHGSDSAASAARELKIFFTESDFVERRHDVDYWKKH
jgi:nucleoside-diphosphate kinase